MKIKTCKCFLLCALCITLLLAVPVGAVQPTKILDSILPDEHYHPGGTTTATDPADGGMPWEGQAPRFGEDPNTEDRAADGSTPDTRVASEETTEAISPWVAVLVVSLAATAVVIAVLYLVPSRKGKK